MKNTVTIDDAKSQWDSLIAGIGRGEEWFITNASGKPVAKLVPATQEAPTTVARWKAFGMLKGQIEVASDFDEPLEDMQTYME